MPRTNNIAPTPQEIKVVRRQTRLTQTEAGRVIYVSLRTRQNWEYGVRPMPLASWELFKIKTGLNNIPFKYIDDKTFND